MPPLPAWGLARPGAGLTKGQPPPKPFQLSPRPGSLTKGQPPPVPFQTQPRPPGATAQTLPPAGQSAAPQPPAAPPSSGGSSQPSALDSTYFANVAANQFRANNSINALNMQGSQASTALQAALGQLAYQQPRDQLRIEQAANARGALYSTPYAQQQGDLVHSYATRQTAARTNYSNLMDRINAQIAALQGGEGLYESGQAAEAAARASARAAGNPALGTPETPAANPPGTVITDTTRATSTPPTLAQAIARRPVVNLASLHPGRGKGRPRQIVNLASQRPTLGKGRPR